MVWNQSFVRSDANDTKTGTLSISQSTQSTPTLELTNSGGGGSGAGTGAVVAKFVGNSDALQIQNISDGDYGIYNIQQNNGIEMYDGTGGVKITYNGLPKIEVTSTGISFASVPTANGSAVLTEASGLCTAVQWLDEDYFRYNGQDGSQTTASIPISGRVAPGDFAIMTIMTDTNKTQTTPSGWTYIGDTGTGEYPRSYMFAKILGGNEIGTTVSQTVNDNWAAVVAYFRPNSPISSFTAKNYNGTKGPSALSLTLSASGVSGACLAFASLTGRTGPQLPQITVTSGSVHQIIYGSAGAPAYVYKAYHKTLTSPTNLGLSVNDTGRQSLGMAYFEFT